MPCGVAHLRRVGAGLAPASPERPGLVECSVRSARRGMWRHAWRLADGWLGRQTGHRVWRGGASLMIAPPAAPLRSRPAGGFAAGRRIFVCCCLRSRCVHCAALCKRQPLRVQQVYSPRNVAALATVCGRAVSTVPRCANGNPCVCSRSTARAMWRPWRRTALSGGGRRTRREWA